MLYSKIQSDDMSQLSGNKFDRLIGLILLCFLVIARPVLAADFSEEKVKAALLYSISKFTTWPEAVFADETAALTICVFGKPFDTLNKKKSKGRPIRVVSLQQGRVADQGCHILFVSRGANASWRERLNFGHGHPILTVSDMSGFSQQGGMIEFKKVGQSMKLLINVATIKRSGVVLSARLLKLATIVNSD